MSRSAERSQARAAGVRSARTRADDAPAPAATRTIKPQTLRLMANAAAFALGAASVLAYAPVGWYPLIFATLGGLYALLCRAANGEGTVKARMREGALLAFAFGLGLFLTGVSWVYVSLSTFGGMPAALAALATFLFCCLLAFFPALAGALFAGFAPSALWRRSLFFAAAWTLAEWVRGWFLGGFPWLAAGYSQAPPSPLSGFAALIGVFGISFLTALCAALFVAAIRRNAGRGRPYGRWASAWPAIALVVVTVGGEELRRHHWTTPVGTPVSVALVQGNIPQNLKWQPEVFAESLRVYYRLVAENPARLTVLPETAMASFLDQLPPGYVDELKRLALRENGDLVMGTVVGNRSRYANAAISVGASNEQRYEKSHLVPFGEFVPPGFSWVLAILHIPMSDFARGAEKQAPMAIAGQKVAVNICYEDAFGEAIITALPEATVLANLSNVAWFGDSLAPAQHLQMAQLRALESGRMILRATNTGMTAIIGADGEVAKVLKPFTRDVLRGEIIGYEGSTPYSRTGNWLVVVGALMLLSLGRWRHGGKI
jgi:apolipoprotein N-acyltransferase